MAKVYAELIVKGVKKIIDVPEEKKEMVKTILIERGYIELITE